MNLQLNCVDILTNCYSLGEFPRKTDASDSHQARLISRTLEGRKERCLGGLPWSLVSSWTYALMLSARHLSMSLNAVRLLSKKL